MTVRHKIGQWDCKGGRATEGERAWECTLKIEREKEVNVRKHSGRVTAEICFRDKRNFTVGSNWGMKTKEHRQLQKEIINSLVVFRH